MYSRVSLLNIIQRYAVFRFSPPGDLVEERRTFKIGYGAQIQGGRQRDGTERRQHRLRGHRGVHVSGVQHGRCHQRHFVVDRTRSLDAQ